MVAMAASQSLDGYRELGAKCAALEAKNEALRNNLDRIINTYDAYRRRGAAPAPMQYAEVVSAIDAARKHD
jgi:hypothetical protein